MASYAPFHGPPQGWEDHQPEQPNEERLEIRSEHAQTLCFRQQSNETRFLVRRDINRADIYQFIFDTSYDQDQGVTNISFRLPNNPSKYLHIESKGESVSETLGNATAKPESTFANFFASIGFGSSSDHFNKNIRIYWSNLSNNNATNEKQRQNQNHLFQLIQTQQYDRFQWRANLYVLFCVGMQEYLCNDGKDGTIYTCKEQKYATKYSQIAVSMHSGGGFGGQPAMGPMGPFGPPGYMFAGPILVGAEPNQFEMYNVPHYVNQNQNENLNQNGSNNSSLHKRNNNNTNENERKQTEDYSQTSMIASTIPVSNETNSKKQNNTNDNNGSIFESTNDNTDFKAPLLSNNTMNDGEWDYSTMNENNADTMTTNANTATQTALSQEQQNEALQQNNSQSSSQMQNNNNNNNNSNNHNYAWQPFPSYGMYRGRGGWYGGGPPRGRGWRGHYQHWRGGAGRGDAGRGRGRGGGRGQERGRGRGRGRGQRGRGGGPPGRGGGRYGGLPVAPSMRRDAYIMQHLQHSPMIRTGRKLTRDEKILFRDLGCIIVKNAVPKKLITKAMKKINIGLKHGTHLVCIFDDTLILEFWFRFGSFVVCVCVCVCVAI